MLACTIFLFLSKIRALQNVYKKKTLVMRLVFYFRNNTAVSFIFEDINFCAICKGDIIVDTKICGFKSFSFFHTSMNI